MDRLLWKWQQRQLSEMLSYEQMLDTKSAPRTSSKDSMPFHTLAEDIMVEDVVDTESGLLCYRYEDYL